MDIVHFTDLAFRNPWSGSPCISMHKLHHVPGYPKNIQKLRSSTFESFRLQGDLPSIDSLLKVRVPEAPIHHG